MKILIHFYIQSCWVGQVIKLICTSSKHIYVIVWRFWLKTQYVTTTASIAYQWIRRAALHRHNRVALRRAQSVDMVGFLLRLKRACQFSRSAAAAVLRNTIATHLRRSWCSGYRGWPAICRYMQINFWLPCVLANTSLGVWAVLKGQT